ncbi:MAG TPA: hypothetical protein VFI31_10385, partial [Pirellulales bacterium]|nr:hypothetical protein [Pirellulales bacterium]
MSPSRIIVVTAVLVAAAAAGWVAWTTAAPARPSRSPHSSSTEDVFVNDAEQTRPKGEAPEGMVWIPGGQFWMGAYDEDEQIFTDAVPRHLVY